MLQDKTGVKEQSSAAGALEWDSMAAQLCRSMRSLGSSWCPLSRCPGAVGVFLLALLATAIAGPIGDGRVQGRKDIEGFRFLSTGACTINEHAIHKYGVSLAASDTIMAVGGDDGIADVQCISASCSYVDSLQFWWSAEVQPTSPGSRRARSAQHVNDEEILQEAGLGLEDDGVVRGIGSARRPRPTKQPQLNATTAGMPFVYRPAKGGAVQVAVKDNFVAFAGAGCVEVSRLAEHAGWQHVTSLPSTLAVTCAGGEEGAACGQLGPAQFGSRVAMDDGVLLAAAEVTMAGAGAAEAAVVAFTRLGAAWQQTDVLRCPGCVCTGGSEGGACFGAAVAVHDELAVVGFPLNNSVVLFKRSLLPSKSIVVAWQQHLVLTSGTATLFGSALALGSSLLAVGFPAAMNSGAMVYRVGRGGAAGEEVELEVLLDSRERCCDIGLPCCDSSHVGASVALSEFAHYDAASQATVAVGDAFSSQVHAFTCNLTKVLAREKHACQMSAAILPGYEREARGDARAGFGSRVAMGGQAVLVGDAADGCEGEGRAGACGTVCEVASCAPGHCLMYDFSTDTDFCQRCADPGKCPGGIRSCVDGEGGTMWAMLLSTSLFVVLFCCLYSLSAWARGAGILDVVSEVLCCGLWVFIPGRGLVFAPGAGEEPLLERRAAAAEEEEESSEDEGGYVPPVVREAFGMQPVEGAAGGGEEEAEEEEERGIGAEGEGEGGGAREGEGGGQEEEEEEEEEEGDGESTRAEKGDAGGAEGEPGPGVGRGEGEEAGVEDAEAGPTVTVGLNYFSCKVCFERPIQTVLVPCGHEALCRKCSRKMKACPICRKSVQKVQAVLQG